MINRLHLCSAFLTSGHSKRITILSHIHTPTAVSATQGDGQLVRCSEGEGVSLRDTSTLLGMLRRCRTSNLLVTSHPLSTSSAI